MVGFLSSLLSSLNKIKVSQVDQFLPKTEIILVHEIRETRGLTWRVPLGRCHRVNPYSSCVAEDLSQTLTSVICNYLRPARQAFPFMADKRRCGAHSQGQAWSQTAIKMAIPHQTSTGKCKIEIHSTPVRWPHPGSLTTPAAEEDMEQSELSLLLVGMQRGAATLENSVVVSYKLNTLLLCDPAIMLVGISSENLKSYVHTKPAHRWL